MYDTLLMLKPDVNFSPDDMQHVVTEVASSSSGEVERRGSTVRLVNADGFIEITPNSAQYVIAESEEIAERFGIPCRGCRSRFEMTGEDADMELFNDYLLINERLQATGHFVIFDAQACKLLFEDE